MSDSKDSDLTTLGAVGVTVLGLPFGLLFMWYGVFAEGYVLSQLWNWFAVPNGLRALSWQTFAALSMAIAIIQLKLPRPEPEDARDRSTKVAACIGYLLAPWAMLLIGWWIK